MPPAVRRVALSAARWSLTRNLVVTALLGTIHPVAVATTLVGSDVATSVEDKTTNGAPGGALGDNMIPVVEVLPALLLPGMVSVEQATGKLVEEYDDRIALPVPSPIGRARAEPPDPGGTAVRAQQQTAGAPTGQQVPSEAPSPAGPSDEVHPTDQQGMEFPTEPEGEPPLAESEPPAADPPSSQTPSSPSSPHKEQPAPCAVNGVNSHYLYNLVPVAVGVSVAMQLTINSKTAQILENPFATGVISAAGATITLCVVGAGRVVGGTSKRLFLRRSSARRTLQRENTPACLISVLPGGGDACSASSPASLGDNHNALEFIIVEPPPATPAAPNQPLPPNWRRILKLLPATGPIAVTSSLLGIITVPQLGVLLFSLLHTTGKVVMGGVVDHLGLIGDTEEVEAEEGGTRREFVYKRRRCSRRRLLGTGVAACGMAVAATTFLDEVRKSFWNAKNEFLGSVRGVFEEGGKLFQPVYAV